MDLAGDGFSGGIRDSLKDFEAAPADVRLRGTMPVGDRSQGRRLGRFSGRS
ncbi:putative rRNA maturation factor (fragment) [Xanthomonas citri pv. fuscans]